MQAEISTLRNMVKHSNAGDAELEASMKQLIGQHQEQFRALFSGLPNRAGGIQQIVADYSNRVQLELDDSQDAP
ncbi:MAG: hypothetical protein CMO80_01570 [Verrucomicrobiales bacterium]|nr:hypothetical protein [Verrucomicrobiales bacterium]|tara:strand:+ start:1254 stop:1475 length:222 start_codon:yes stop_codon:yes gene_type:complete